MKQNLNQNQKEATLHTEGPLLILAGAGAGKTKTIVERVVNIIKSKGVAPNNILCVTFTNKAASEMRERITLRLKEENIINNYDSFASPMVKTFHSLGLYILKREHSSLGLNKHFTIIDPDDGRSIVKEFLEKNDYDTKTYDPSRIRNTISIEKGNKNTVSDYDKKIGNFTMEVISKAWRYYDNKLKETQSLDFDDLIIKTTELLENNKEIRDKYQREFKYIHIDEYQDTNNSQYELCNLLVDKDKSNICVVGDIDQNIYSWRGANLKNIMNFEEFYKNKKVKTILLEQNYRSTNKILKLANATIKKNEVRKDKNLFTENGEGEDILILPNFDGESESENIAKRCKALIQDGVNPNDIAILYRTNFQSRLLEEKMLSNNVPYNLLGLKFFERKEIKDMLSYLKASINRDSAYDLKRVLETPKKGIGKVTLAKILAKEPLPQAQVFKLEKVYTLLNKIKENLESGEFTLSEVLTFILTESGIESELKEDGDDGVMRLLNISELINVSESYNTGDTMKDLDNFLESSALQSDQDNDKEDKPGVRLMTVHASKGLEFEYVFIAGLEQDLFPSKDFSGKKRTQEESEEERRLFYVAVTRARKQLFLSYAEMRTIFGERGIRYPSEFLEDLTPEISSVEETYYRSGDSSYSGKVIYI